MGGEEVARLSFEVEAGGINSCRTCRSLWSSRYDVTAPCCTPMDGCHRMGPRGGGEWHHRWYRVAFFDKRRAALASNTN